MFALTYLCLLALVFFLGRMMPVDPLLSIAGDHASDHVYQQLRLDLGLNDPLIQQFWRHCLRIVHGDLGNSALTGQPVLDDILRVFPATVELATLGLLIGCFFAVPLGIISAVKRNGLIDQIVRLVSLVGHSAPIFWVGPLALFLFYFKLDWVSGPGRLDIIYTDAFSPVTGMILIDSVLSGSWDVFRNAFSHIVLPGVLLGFFSFAHISRMTRSFMLRELSRDYIITARIRGLSECRIVLCHALRNAMMPLIGVIAWCYAHLLEGAVLTEMVFSWPGLGQYAAHALQSADMNAMLGAILVIGSLFICFNLLSDAFHRFLDPRMRG